MKHFLNVFQKAILLLDIVKFVNVQRFKNCSKREIHWSVNAI